MLPFFFAHYDSLVARYFIFDNGSTDGSRAMLARHPKVTLGELAPQGNDLIAAAPGFYETCWHGSREAADWVFIVNIDEHLHHRDGLAYFARCLDRGITVIPAKGYEMVSDTFPAGEAALTGRIRSGVRHAQLDKICVFRPDAVARINYSAGRHRAEPAGRVVTPRRTRLKLLHYKYLGLPYVAARYAELRERIGAADRERGWGRHYFQAPDEIAGTHRHLLAVAKPVKGL